MSPMDIADTTRCPIAAACESCGGRAAPACDMPDGCGAAAGQPCEPGCPSLAADPNGPAGYLAVASADTPVGVICLTLCGSCAEAGALPRIPSWSAAIRRVHEHCEHIGRDVDGNPLDEPVRSGPVLVHHHGGRVHAPGRQRAHRMRAPGAQHAR
jgi:hypothetical protein